MIPFHLARLEIAARETHSLIVSPGPVLPAGEYADVEFYCPEVQTARKQPRGGGFGG